MFPPARILGHGIACAAGLGAAEAAAALATAPAPPPPLHLEATDRTLPFFSVQLSAAEAAGRLYALVAAAVEEAIEMAGLTRAQRARALLLLGSSSLELPAAEARYARALAAGGKAIPLSRAGFALLAADIARQSGIGGGEYIFSTACTSSANALLYGQRFIAAGRADHVVVVGCEAFNQLTLAGFDGLMLLTTDRMQPFDRERSGTVLGEGAGALVLGPESGDRTRFRLLGGANCCDGQNPTASSPEAIQAVVSRAAANAGLAIDAVDLVKAHGTATPANDAAEAAAMHALFGERLPDFTVLKGHLGHTLGACGALETVALLACLERGFVPPTAGFSQRDEGLNLAPLSAPRPFVQGHVMCNFFGFGGNNCSLIISNHDR